MRPRASTLARSTIARSTIARSTIARSTIALAGVGALAATVLGCSAPAHPRDPGVATAADARAVAVPDDSPRCRQWPTPPSTSWAPPPSPDDALARRGLTAAEIALIWPLFQTSIDYAQVEVVPERYTIFQPAGVYMTPDGNIYAPGHLFRADFAAAGVDLQALFVHEMTHVWQRQNGVDLVAAWVQLLETTGGAYDLAYAYALETGDDLLDFGMEQQASIIADYFLRCAHAQPPQRRRLPERPDGLALDDDASYERVLAAFLADPTYLRSRVAALK